MLVFLATASEASTNPAWSLRTWQSDDGLPNNMVIGLAQTSDGYLYLASPNRLARFDGVSFEEFACADFAGGLDRKIRSIAATRHGGVCVAMDGALAVLEPGLSRLVTNGLEQIIPHSLIEDGQGAFWIVHGKSRVCRVANGQVKQFGAADGLDDTHICTLAVDSQGRLWFGQGRAVGIFRNERFETLVRAPGTGTRVAAARDGGVWVYSNGDVLKYHEGGRLEERGRLIDRMNRTPNVFLESRDGAIWIGTPDHGLYRDAGDGFEAAPTSHSDILDMLEDREGNFWVGTSGGGLDRLNLRAVELLQGVSGKPSEAINSICEDTNGTIWIATQNAELACRTNSEWRNFLDEAPWPAGGATCVAAAGDGGVWIGTPGHGLRHWRDGAVETFLPSASGLARPMVRGLLVARNGDVWIAEQYPGTLQHLHGGQFRTIALPADTRVIQGMAEDSRGNIWIGMAGGALLCVSNDIATDMTGLTLSEPKSIRCLQTTPDGSLWIGYAGAGVGRLKNGSFLHVLSDQGLYDNSVSQILYDNRGWMWFGADHGIFKVRQQDFDALAERRDTRVHSVHYGRDEGAPSLEANIGNCPSSVRSSDGRLWMCMRNGVAVMDPGELHVDAEPPPVLIKRLLVDDHPVAIYGGSVPVTNAMDLERPLWLKVPPGHRRLEFQFAALTFRAPENVRFRYRLEGFDTQWFEAGNQRSATYSQLPAGDYRFHVKACNSDGIWNETGSTLAFTVTPYFWQTWWFRIAAMTVFAAGIGAAVRYVSVRRLRLRVQALERQAALDRERARIARNIHDDLGSRLTQITLLGSQLLGNGASQEKVAERLEQISQMARSGIQSLDETVWAVNPRNDTLSHLIDYVGQYAADFLRAAGIEHRIDLPKRAPDEPVFADVRHNLFMAVKESLNNVVRHAGASRVELQLTLSEKSIRIVIRDDGRGFGAVQNDANADGLRNMQQRMTEIGGQFGIESKPGAGTQVSLSVPWRNGK